MRIATLALAVILTLAGCASNSINPSSFSTLQYGSARQEVLSRLGQPGTPIFKFGESQKTYFAETYSPGDTLQNYVFLYEESNLVSVITTEAGKKIWEQVFGQYGKSLPVSVRFQDVLKHVLSARLDLQRVNFSAANKEAQVQRQKGINESVAANLLMPLGLIFVVATAPVSVPMMVGVNSEFETREAAFIAQADRIPLGASSALVRDFLGAPVAEFENGEEKILVFDPSTKNLILRSKVSIGLSNDTVTWVGYYFDARRIMGHPTRWSPLTSQSSADEPRRAADFPR